MKWLKQHAIYILRSFICIAGITSAGMRCDAEVDKCSVNNGGCHPDAYCINTLGSVACSCKGGYIGDGSTCTGLMFYYMSSLCLSKH